MYDDRALNQVVYNGSHGFLSQDRKRFYPYKTLPLQTHDHNAQRNEIERAASECDSYNQECMHTIKLVLGREPTQREVIAGGLLLHPEDRPLVDVIKSAQPVPRTELINPFQKRLDEMEDPERFHDPTHKPNKRHIAALKKMASDWEDEHTEQIDLGTRTPQCVGAAKAVAEVSEYLSRLKYSPHATVGDLEAVAQLTVVAQTDPEQATARLAEFDVQFVERTVAKTQSKLDAINAARKNVLEIRNQAEQVGKPTE